MAGVTGRTADLINFQNHGIIVTVDSYFFDYLYIAGGFSFYPKLLPGTAVIRGLSGGESGFPSLLIHKRQHQYLPGFIILNNSRYQSTHFFEIEFDHCVISFVQITVKYLKL